MVHKSNSIQTFSTRRVEMLTDGVFAIAMTILVLDLRVSDLGQAVSSGQLFDYFVNNRASFLSFIISFLLLGSIWAVHMRQFQYIVRADRRLVMINNIRLLFVVLVPLSTSIAGAYSDAVLACVLLPINFFAITLVSYWQWNYAVNDKNKLDNNLSQKDKLYFHAHNKIILLMSVAVVAASIFVGAAAFLLFLCLPIFNKSRRSLIRGK